MVRVRGCLSLKTFTIVIILSTVSFTTVGLFFKPLSHKYKSLLGTTQQLVKEAEDSFCENSSVAVLIIGKESRANVLATSLKSIKDHLLAPIQRSGVSLYVAACVDFLSQVVKVELRKYLDVDDFFEFTSEDQFIRAHNCYSIAILKRGQHYSHVIKTRPDTVWLEDIGTPFTHDTIMLRARRISGAYITSRHLSFPTIASDEFASGCECGDGTEGADPRRRCVMVDDQFAVVPLVWQLAYFTLELQQTIGRNLSDTDTCFSRGDSLDMKYELSPEMISMCPCVDTDFPEANLTRRLAAKYVNVTVSPFNFILTHWGSVNWPLELHRDDDGQWC